MTEINKAWNGTWVVYGYDAGPYARAQYRGDTGGRAAAYMRVVEDGIYEKVAWWPFDMDFRDAINEWENENKPPKTGEKGDVLNMNDETVRAIVRDELEKINNETSKSFADDLYRAALDAMRNYGRGGMV